MYIHTKNEVLDLLPQVMASYNHGVCFTNVCVELSMGHFNYLDPNPAGNDRYLQQVELDTMSNRQCPYSGIQNGHLCAHATHKGVCQVSGSVKFYQKSQILGETNFRFTFLV